MGVYREPGSVRLGGVSSRGQLLVVGLHAILGLAVLISATVLTAVGRDIGPELATLYGAIIGLAGGGSAAVSALGATVNGKSVVSPALLSEMQATLSSSIDHLADARRQVDAQRPLIDLAASEHRPTGV